MVSRSNVIDNLFGGRGGELKRSSSGMELGPILSLGGRGGGAADSGGSTMATVAEKNIKVMLKKAT